MSAIRKKQQTKQVAEHFRSSEAIALYKRLKNKLKATIQSVKLHCLQTLLQQSCKCSHLVSKLWSQINDAIGRQRYNVVSSVNAEHSLDGLNHFFRTVAISSNHRSASCFYPKIPFGNDRFRFGMVTGDEVLYQLQHLDTQKSTGPDGISHSKN